MLQSNAYCAAISFGPTQAISMYRINQISNRITKIKNVRFGDLNLREREHLQEWLANQADALGEELLICAKEFNGFDDTKERLDLLAIDKDGALVIIENKLDDSGKDVVWQSLKYASYCSTLSKTSIAEIYQKYLDKERPGQDAKALICEFLQEETFDEVVLNPGNDQRIIMVAAQFRKEVTSTVLWLLKHRIFLKCFKATPFQDGNDLFLTIEQVIPLPEAEELMIGISQKEVEEQDVERGNAKVQAFRVDFWHQALKALKDAGVRRYLTVSPMKDNWLYARCGVRGLRYGMVFTKDEARVEFGLATDSKENNKVLFDLLFKQRETLNATFGAELNWRRMEDKKSSLIEFSKEFDGRNRAHWPSMIAWLVEHMQRLEKAFEPQLPVIRDALAQISNEATELVNDEESDDV